MKDNLIKFEENNYEELLEAFKEDNEDLFHDFVMAQYEKVMRLKEDLEDR